MNQKYRHYKGDIYELLHEATNSETEEKVVVYRSIKDGRVWVRPREMFFEEVKIDGKLIPRFKKI